MDVIYVFKRRTTNINIRYRLFMRKIKGDCDVIAYTDVVLTPKRKKEKKKKQMGWIARLHAPPIPAATWLRRPAGHPEEEDAAGSVNTLSNKANHSAVVLMCFIIIILLLLFHFEPI